MDMVARGGRPTMRHNSSGRRILALLGISRVAGCKRDPTRLAHAGAVSQTTTNNDSLTDSDHAEINAAKAIRPSVVRIDVELTEERSDGTIGGDPGQDDVPDFLRRFFEFGNDGRGTPAPIRATGSGVIIDAAGHVITNAHVTVDVSPDGAAARAGLQPGDVVVEIDRKAVTTGEAATRALKGGANTSHTLRVLGAAGARFVTLGRR